MSGAQLVDHQQRVTARTVVTEAGETETIYRVDGRPIGSRETLEAVLGDAR